MSPRQMIMEDDARAALQRTEEATRGALLWRFGPHSKRVETREAMTPERGAIADLRRADETAAFLHALLMQGVEATVEAQLQGVEMRLSNKLDALADQIADRVLALIIKEFAE